MHRRAEWAILAATGILLWFAAPIQSQVIVADSGVGYIDNAIPGTYLRLRGDAAYGNNFPNRAEFFWPAGGSTGREGNVDYQDLTSYMEYAPADWLSVFAELPVRFLNPTVNDNTAGFSDMNVGLKNSLFRDDCSVVTFQFRTYIPTGDGERRLGTDHVSLEPALLVFRRLSERLVLEGELRDWIPIGGTEGFAGNVLRYGVGLSWLAHHSELGSIRPVAETIGWTVLDGKKSNVTGIFDASGNTMVNVKLGVRLGFGESLGVLGERNSLYIGYGRALTGNVWYEDMARVEYRLAF